MVTRFQQKYGREPELIVDCVNADGELYGGLRRVGPVYGMQAYRVLEMAGETE